MRADGPAPDIGGVRPVPVFLRTETDRIVLTCGDLVLTFTPADFKRLRGLSDIAILRLADGCFDWCTTVCEAVPSLRRPSR